MIYAPGKAANAGGVSCSQFEMAQNASGTRWSENTVDEALKGTMAFIHEQCYETAIEYGQKNNYAMGANIAGFKRVADAMLDQGMV
jgi:glutamate dehydrogenase (NADP+)